MFAPQLVAARSHRSQACFGGVPCTLFTCMQTNQHISHVVKIMDKLLNLMRHPRPGHAHLADLPVLVICRRRRIPHRACL